MSYSEAGWSWFEADHRISGCEEPNLGVDPDLLGAYARFIKSKDGCRIMRHLRTITLERVVGPDVSQSTLRHLEGQRQLVTYIGALARREGGHVDVRDLTTIEDTEIRSGDQT